MADYQKHPIFDPNTDMTANNGAMGQFICSSTNPFDYTTLTGSNKGKMGNAFVLWTKDGTNPVITSIVTNGVLGDTASLSDSNGWPSGFGQSMEIESMTVAAGTYAFIYLKEIKE